MEFNFEYVLFNSYGVGIPQPSNQRQFGTDWYLLVVHMLYENTYTATTPVALQLSYLSFPGKYDFWNATKLMSLAENCHIKNILSSSLLKTSVSSFLL